MIRHLRAYRTRVPGGTSASTADRPRIASSPAARIIPSLRTPRIVVGTRFATMMTVFPTSASGAYFSAMPATIERGWASPRSTERCRSFLAPSTAAAVRTRPVRSSSFLNSSNVIGPGGASGSLSLAFLAFFHCCFTASLTGS